MRRDQPSVAATRTRPCCSPFARDGASERMITIPGFGDHVRADWPITINGMRTLAATVCAELRSACRSRPASAAYHRAKRPAEDGWRDRRESRRGSAPHSARAAVLGNMIHCLRKRWRMPTVKINGKTANPTAMARWKLLGSGRRRGHRHHTTGHIRLAPKRVADRKAARQGHALADLAISRAGSRTQSTS